MKQLLFTILTLSALSLTFDSCSNCRECTLTITTKFSNGDTDKSEETAEYCGQALRDIEDTETYTKDSLSYRWECE